MIIIRPAAVNDARLASSNVPETDAPEWAVGTTYALDAEVMVTLDGVHSIFKSLIASNVGNVPQNDDPVTPSFWARVSATNRWAMFSDQLSDQTEQADSIIVELAGGSVVNSLALYRLDGTAVRVTMTDPIEGVVYDRESPLVDQGAVSDWYAYYFEPITRQTTLGLLDLPPYASAVLRVEIKYPSSIAKCGLLTFGAQFRVGETDWGASVGIVDYSRKERDTFGRPVIVERNYSRRSNYAVTVDTSFVAAVQDVLAAYRTVPLTWIGSELYPSTVVYGYYRDFDLVLSNYTKSLLNIEVEGLT